MLERTDNVVQAVLNELKCQPLLSALTEIAPAIHEWSPKALHFSALEAASGREVIIKTDVSDSELYWTTRLSAAAPEVFPQVLAADYLFSECLDSRFGYIAAGKIPYGLIDPLWEGRQPILLLDAVAQFYQAACSVKREYLTYVTLDTVQSWLAEGVARNPPGDWKSVLSQAEQDYTWLLQICPSEVCHGDLHIGNAVSRTPPPAGPALLIDINPVWQPWIFDAAHLEAYTWTEQPLRGTGYMIRELAERRAALGMEVPSEDALERAAAITLSWYAIKNWHREWLEFMPGFEAATERYINLGALFQRE
jgi:hypothetical protein